MRRLATFLGLVKQEHKVEAEEKKEVREVLEEAREEVKQSRERRQRLVEVQAMLHKRQVKRRHM